MQQSELADTDRDNFENNLFKTRTLRPGLFSVSTAMWM
jgi:hypothetical protein